MEGLGRESGDGGENLVCRFGPTKGRRLLVMSCDEFADGFLQFLYAAVRPAFDLALGEQDKPALDLIQPGGVRGGEV